MKSQKAVLIWSRVLMEILPEKTSSEQKKILDNLELFLKRKKKENLLPAIIRRTQESLEKKEKIELFLASDQEAETVNRLKEKLLERLGKEKKIEITINKEIIGGFEAKTENCQVKASIRDHLSQLKNFYG